MITRYQIKEKLDKLAQDEANGIFKNVTILTFDNLNNLQRNYFHAPCYAQLCPHIKDTPNFEYALLPSLKNYFPRLGKGPTCNSLLTEWALNEKHTPFKNMLTIIKDYLGFKQWKNFVKYTLDVGLVIPRPLVEQFSAAAIMSLSIIYRLQYDIGLNKYVKEAVKKYPNIPPGFLVWYGMLTNQNGSTTGYKPFAVEAWSNHINLLAGEIEPIRPKGVNIQNGVQDFPLLHKEGRWSSAGMPVYAYFTKTNVDPEQDIWDRSRPSGKDRALKEASKLLPSLEKKTQYGTTIDKTKAAELWEAYQKQVA